MYTGYLVNQPENAGTMPVNQSFRQTLAATLVAVFLLLLPIRPMAADLPHLDTPPLGEKWFSILLNNTPVGFYHQQIGQFPNGGYHIEAQGSSKIKIMGFTNESSFNEVYTVDNNLALQSLQIRQIINGRSTIMAGELTTAGLLVAHYDGEKQVSRTFNAKGPIYPGPVLNLIPFFKSMEEDEELEVISFDPEDFKLKEVEITLHGLEETDSGQQAFRLANDLYPFVSNQIWVDQHGNTLLESVRDGLVVTRSENVDNLVDFISNLLLANPELGYIFNLDRFRSALQAPFPAPEPIP